MGSAKEMMQVQWRKSTEKLLIILNGKKMEGMGETLDQRVQIVCTKTSEGVPR